jgi:hypothetical protein
MEGQEILAYFNANQSTHSDNSDCYYADANYVDFSSGIATVLLKVWCHGNNTPVTFVDGNNFSPDSVRNQPHTIRADDKYETFVEIGVTKADYTLTKYICRK